MHHNHQQLFVEPNHTHIYPQYGEKSRSKNKGNKLKNPVINIIMIEKV